MCKSLLLGVAVLFAAAVTLQAADPPVTTPGQTTQGNAKVTMKPTFKASTLIGMNVKNSLGENVGTVDELVIDPLHGNIRYAALGVGGFLGLGEKLFAVPWESLSMKVDENDHYFFLDVDKEKLKNAPGFSKDKWPDFGNPKFGEEIDRYYGVHHVARQPGERTTPAPAPNPQR